MPEITVISRTAYATVNEKRQLVESTFVVYKDKAGRVGTIVIDKAKPSDADVETEVKKRQSGK